MKLVRQWLLAMTLPGILLFSACSPGAREGDSSSSNNKTSFTLDAPREWGKNALLVSNASGSLVVEFKNGLTLEGQFPGNTCTYSRTTEQWSCFNAAFGSKWGQSVGY